MHEEARSVLSFLTTQERLENQKKATLLENKEKVNPFFFLGVFVLHVKPFYCGRHRLDIFSTGA